MIRNIITIVIILIILHYFGWFSIAKIGAPGCPIFGAGHCDWQIHLFSWDFII